MTTKILISRQLRQALVERGGLSANVRGMYLPADMPKPDEGDKAVNNAHVRLNDTSRAYYELLGNGDLSCGIHRHYGWWEIAGGWRPVDIAGHPANGRPGSMPYRLALPAALIYWCDTWGAGTVSETLERRLGAGVLVGQLPRYDKPRVIAMLTPDTLRYYDQLEPPEGAPITVTSLSGVQRGIVTHFYTITGKP